MRSLTLIAIIFLLGAPTLPAQSMAEAAKKEKERREKIAEEAQAEVVTEEDLELADGDLANEPDAKPVVKDEPDKDQALRDELELNGGAAGMEMWRSMAMRAEMRVKIARREVEKFERLFLGTSSTYVDRSTGEIVFASAEELRLLRAKAEDKLQEAEAALARVHEDARRMRIPSEWLREQ